MRNRQSVDTGPYDNEIGILRLNVLSPWLRSQGLACRHDRTGILDISTQQNLGVHSLDLTSRRRDVGVEHMRVCPTALC